LSSALPASARELWDATLSQLLLRVTRQNFDTWLRATTGRRFEGTTLVVEAPNELACDWLSTRMRTVIAQALTAVAGPGLQVRFEPPQEGAAEAGNEPLQPSLLPSLQTPLNPRFTFATFLESDFNRFAATAARALASEGDCPYSPLFITGAAGSGKTHLLHAIAHEAARARIRFLLVAADHFVNEFTNAVRNKTGAAFRARYRDLDLLLIDDVHQFLGKKATLVEFFQTLSALHDQGRRVAVAGDAAAMAGAGGRFHDQLRWGLVAGIGLPSLEERVMYVAAKAGALGLDLPQQVQHYVAIRIRNSIRDLEGAANRISALSRITSAPIDIDFAARALQPVSTTAANETPPVAPTDLLDAVCRHLSLSLNDIASPKRARALTYARHLAMYLLREDAGLTYSAIAHLLGKKDHSTVVHAYNELLRRLDVSPNVRADIDAVRAALRLPPHVA